MTTGDKGKNLINSSSYRYDLNQMEKTRGNTEEANALLDKWTNECELIKTEYPYFNN